MVSLQVRVDTAQVAKMSRNPRVQHIIFIFMCIHTYIYIYIDGERERVCVYIYIYMRESVCVCVCFQEPLSMLASLHSQG